MIYTTAFKGTNREFSGNLAEIAKHFNINYAVFKSRLQQGYTPEEAIDWNGRKIDRRPKTVFKNTDREFTGSYRKIAKHFNINYGTFANRLKLGYTIEEAINWNGGKIDRSPKTVFKNTDREFTGNYVEIAKHFNINYSKFQGRLHQGYTPEEIIDWGGGKFKIYTVFKDTDKEFTGNFAEISRHFNINYSTFKDRLQQGYTIEESINIPLNKVHINNLSYKDFKGNLREICKHFNKDYIEVYNKLKYNHTLEWSIESTNELYTKE